MLAYWPFLAALLAGGAAPDVLDLDLDVVSVEATAGAERDFDLRRAELGLVGSAPFYGVEEPKRARAAEARDFDERMSELGLIGSAPFYGMDDVQAPVPSVAKAR